MNTVLSYIKFGHSEGAKLVVGGNRILQETHHYQALAVSHRHNLIGTKEDHAADFSGVELNSASCAHPLAQLAKHALANRADYPGDLDFCKMLVAELIYRTQEVTMLSAVPALRTGITATSLWLNVWVSCSTMGLIE